MPDILVLFDSRHGATTQLAQHVARGIDAVSSMQARIRCVPRVSSVCETSEDSIPEDGPPYASLGDLQECAGLPWAVRHALGI